mgnify:CR=1 FL=1
MKNKNNNNQMGALVAVTENKNTLIDLAKEYEQLMLVYENGAKLIETKFQMLSNEFKAMGDRNPIESIKSRIKSPKSLYAKMKKKGLSVTAQNMRDNIFDIAGVRVICSYISDIYTLRDMLLCHKDIHLLYEKDYIKNPKPNGYRSLHLIVECLMPTASGEYPVCVEIQFRTIAMDFWASLEHEIRYKSKDEIPQDLCQDLCECAEIISLTDRRMERIHRQVENTHENLR